MDYIFLLISAVFVIVSWNTTFRWVSLALFADFCMYVGFDSFILSKENVLFLGDDTVYEIFMPLKGTIGVLFYMVFLNIAIYLKRCSPSSVIAFILSGLSIFSAQFHWFVAYLHSRGITFTEEYTNTMIIYCILQLTIFAGGLLYGYIHRSDLNLDFLVNRFGHHKRGSKGT